MKVKRDQRRWWIPAGLLAGSVLLAGCNHGSDSTPATMKRMFKVEVTNLTANQPLSPIAAVLHRSGYHAWQEGNAATVGLERLAESGDGADLLSEAQSDSAFLSKEAGSGVIPPGQSGSIQMEAAASDPRLSLVTMLVNTNDAFAGLDAVDLSSLAPGEQLTVSAIAHDAGTEPNSETAATVPGPAGGGEGFNADRSGDVDFIAVHRGVVTRDDGLANSALDQSHRFDNPVARVVITRLQ